MQNCYAALGVTHDVTPQVAKIAFEGKMKALAKAGLSESERRAEERLLAQAFATLSNPAKKDWYDKQWMKHGEREEKAAVASNRRGWTLAAVMTVLLVGASSYYFVNRANEREKLRLEAVRIANEKEAADKKAALEQAALEALKDADAARMEYANRVQTARERAYSDSVSYAKESRANAEAARARSLDLTAERLRQQDEQRQRMQDDAARRQAQADVERQKRFVAQREYEEQRAAAEREARVRYEADRRARDAAIAARANASR